MASASPSQRADLESGPSEGGPSAAGDGGDGYLDFVTGEVPGDADEASEAREGAGVGQGQGGALSMEEYAAGVRALRARHLRASAAARRSSVSFLQRHAASDADALARFLTALSQGLVVRRHQSDCASEPVRLFSLNGGRTVQWAVEAGGAGHAQARGAGWDCCAALCGCGDDLQYGEEDAPQPPPLRQERSWLRGLLSGGFQTKGSFG